MCYWPSHKALHPPALWGQAAHQRHICSLKAHLEHSGLVDLLALIILRHVRHDELTNIFGCSSFCERSLQLATFLACCTEPLPVVLGPLFHFACVTVIANNNCQVCQLQISAGKGLRPANPLKKALYEHHIFHDFSVLIGNCGHHSTSEGITWQYKSFKIVWKVLHHVAAFWPRILDLVQIHALLWCKRVSFRLKREKVCDADCAQSISMSNSVWPGRNDMEGLGDANITAHTSAQQLWFSISGVLSIAGVAVINDPGPSTTTTDHGYNHHISIYIYIQTLTSHC